MKKNVLRRQLPLALSLNSRRDLEFMTITKIQVYLRGLHFVSLYAGKRNEFLLSVSAANLETMYEFDVQNAREKPEKNGAL